MQQTRVHVCWQKSPCSCPPDAVFPGDSEARQTSVLWAPLMERKAEVVGVVGGKCCRATECVGNVSDVITLDQAAPSAASDGNQQFVVLLFWAL